MIHITSKNRTQARRLLNNWQDSRIVRKLTLEELSDALQRVVNDEYMTESAINRMLSIVKEPPKGRLTDGDGTTEDGPAPEDGQTDNDLTGEPDNSGDGDGTDSQDSGDTDGGGQGDGGEGGDGKQTGNESDDDGDGDDDNDSGDSGDGDDEPEADDEMTEQRDDDSPQEDNDDDDKDSEETDGGEEPEQEKGEKSEKQDESETSPDEPEPPWDGKHAMFATVLKYIRAGLNVALIGPAGTGKSTLAAQVFEALGLEFRGCGALMSKYDLIGYMDAHGTYHETPFYQAYTTGTGFCFDELDGSAPDAVVSFNAATDNQPVFAFPNGMQPRHERFVAIACLNTYGNGASADYVGRFKQDAAVMSRYVKVYIDYDERIEENLGTRIIVDRVQAVRKACGTLAIRHIVSTRMIAQSEAARTIGKATKAEIDRDIIFAGLDDGAIRQVKSQMLKDKRGES